MPAPSSPSVVKHRLVGIRLHGIADEGIPVGESLREDPIVPFERGRRIAIERRPDLVGDLAQVHVLGMQHAVAIGEMMHGAALKNGSRMKGVFGIVIGRFWSSRRSDGRRQRTLRRAGAVRPLLRRRQRADPAAPRARRGVRRRKGRE